MIHCHLISSSDVLRAITKLTTDKVNDNGLVYSNNRPDVTIFKHTIHVNGCSWFLSTVICMC